MTIDYKASSDLMRNEEFKGRTRIACLHYSAFISNEAGTVPAHVSRMKWATRTFESSEAAVDEVMPILIMDPKVQEAGAAITDADLQSAVETSVNKTI